MRAEMRDFEKTYKASVAALTQERIVAFAAIQQRIDAAVAVVAAAMQRDLKLDERVQACLDRADKRRLDKAAAEAAL